MLRKYFNSLRVANWSRFGTALLISAVSLTEGRITKAAILVPTTGVAIDWTDVANWDTATVPNGISQIVQLDPGADDRIVQFNQAITLGTLLINHAVAPGNYSNTIEAGSAGTLTFDNAGVAATITLNAGLDSPATTLISAPIALTAGATVTVSPDGTLRLTGAVTGAGLITKAAGSGALIINGNVSNAVTTGPAATINGTLGGNGSFTGLVRAANGASRGIISPGDPLINNGVGTLTIGALQLQSAQGTNFNNAGRVRFDLDSPTQFDQLIVNGAVNLRNGTNPVAGRLVLDFDDGFAGGAIGDFIKLIDKTADGAITNTFLNASGVSIDEGGLLSVPLANDVYDFTYTYVGGDGNDFGLTISNITPVPEPSALALFAIGLFGGLLVFRRRRRS